MAVHEHRLALTACNCGANIALPIWDMEQLRYKHQGREQPTRDLGDIESGSLSLIIRLHYYLVMK